MTTTTFPFAPLEAMVLDPSLPHNVGPIKSAAAALGITPDSLRQYRHRGVSADLADRLAVRAGLHPFDVWGHDWFASVEDCDRCGDYELCSKHEKARRARLRRHARRQDAVRPAAWWRGRPDQSSPQSTTTSEVAC